MVTSSKEHTRSLSADINGELDYHLTQHGPSVSLLSTTQEKSLRDLLSETDSSGRRHGSQLSPGAATMDAKPTGLTRKKRGRKPAKVDVEARLQRSRQSARECRARKKMRYRLLEELIDKKETENLELRKELEKCLHWFNASKAGEKVPSDIIHQYKKDLKKTKNTAMAEQDDS